MAKRRTSSRSRSATPAREPGFRSQLGPYAMRSWNVGAVPIVNRFLERMKLEEFFRRHLPTDDPRLEVPTASALLVLLRNLLISREPLYGIGEWAARCPADLLGLSARQVEQLHDDRLGHALDRLFDVRTGLALDVVQHVLAEFSVGLDELHNDGTTISFFGAYAEAAEEQMRRGRRTPAITWGHSKDRPDLKQLLYTLTITEDGGVPVYFQTDSGNMTDDQLHPGTWDVLRQLVGRPDFLYVADCKLATTANMAYIASRQGRFVTILPRTRKEDAEFRQRLEEGRAVPWEVVWQEQDEAGEVVDVYRVCREEWLTAEGYRLHWFHSQCKAESDAATRARQVQRATTELQGLAEKLASPRTRYKERAVVERAVAKILEDRGVESWLRVQIEEQEQATFKQARRGRPTADTPYVKSVSRRYGVKWELDAAALARSARSDGVFPIVTNDQALAAVETLRAYKRRPRVEKRFSQFKTDFEVAPVYLKEISRIVALLTMYFFVLLVQTLLERELRRAMAASGRESLPLYPEGRPCKTPTTRRLLDVFEGVQRHELRTETDTQVVVTELTDLQRDLLQFYGLSPDQYGHRG